MNLQHFTIEATRAAHEEAFRYALAVPADKLNWSPIEAGRTVLDLAREMAMCPDWAYDIVAGAGMDFSPEGQEVQGAQMASWLTIADCEAACATKLDRYYGLIKDLPESRLAETVVLPFGPGGSDKVFNLPEVLDYPRWNLTYHLGQIAYIQTLYGDKGTY